MRFAGAWRRCDARVPPPPVNFGAVAVWEIVFMLVILKIPIAYVGWVVWWAIRAVPEVGTEGGTEGVNWKPWERSSGPRPRRGGPHGMPERRTARAERKRERMGV